GLRRLVGALVAVALRALVGVVAALVRVGAALVRVGAAVVGAGAAVARAVGALARLGEAALGPGRCGQGEAGRDDENDAHENLRVYTPPPSSRAAVAVGDLAGGLWFGLPRP